MLIFSSVKHIDSEVLEKEKEDYEKQPFGNAHSVFLNFVTTMCFEKNVGGDLQWSTRNQCCESIRMCVLHFQTQTLLFYQKL